jgi:hypothetical protein
MFNLLSFYEGKFPQYQVYMEGFMEVLGPKYGAQPRLLGPLVKDEEGAVGEDKPWDMVGLIHYPGNASFGRMLEDEAYKTLDRKYKKGVVKDNLIFLIVELEERSGGGLKGWKKRVGMATGHKIERVELKFGQKR